MTTTKTERSCAHDDVETSRFSIIGALLIIFDIWTRVTCRGSSHFIRPRFARDESTYLTTI